MGFAFMAHGRPLPTAAGSTGADRARRITVDIRPRGRRRPGRPVPALDFCLLVTQRRHRADLALVATGPVADEWLDIAQAFAGPPGRAASPSEPRQRSAPMEAGDDEATARR